MAKMSLFSKVVTKGFLGALLGVLSGAVLSLLIFGVIYGFKFIDKLISGVEGYSGVGAHLADVGFFAMGAGAIVGGIAGVMATLKDGGAKKLF